MDFAVFATKTDYIVKKIAKNFDKNTSKMLRYLQRITFYTIVIREIIRSVKVWVPIQF